MGYGTQKKTNLTGAVDVISGEQLANRSAAKVADLLKGTSPNLQITMDLHGGEPGAESSWNVRGLGYLIGEFIERLLVYWILIFSPILPFLVVIRTTPKGAREP